MGESKREDKTNLKLPMVISVMMIFIILLCFLSNIVELITKPANVATVENR